MHQLKVKPGQQLLQHPRPHLLLRLLSLSHQPAAVLAVKAKRLKQSLTHFDVDGLAIVSVTSGSFEHMKSSTPDVIVNLVALA